MRLRCEEVQVVPDVLAAHLVDDGGDGLLHLLLTVVHSNSVKVDL